MSIADGRFVENRRSAGDRTLPLVRPQSVTQKIFKAVTRKFFQEGEQQEKEGWKNEPPEYFDPKPGMTAEVDPVLATETPRQRKPVILIASVSALLLSAVAFGMAWRMSKTRAPENASLNTTVPVSNAAAGNLAADPQANTHAVVPLGDTPPNTPPAVTGAAAMGSSPEAAVPTTAATTAENSQAKSGVTPTGAAAAKDSDKPVPSAPSTSARAAASIKRAGVIEISPPQPTASANDLAAVAPRHERAIAADTVTRDRPGAAEGAAAETPKEGQPLRGVVWSPAKQALVPAESLATDDAIPPSATSPSGTPPSNAPSTIAPSGTAPSGTTPPNVAPTPKAPIIE